MTREIFIPIGRGVSSEVYVDGAVCIAQYINLEKVSRLQNQAGQTMSFTGEQMRAIITRDERNHKYYRDCQSPVVQYNHITKSIYSKLLTLKPYLLKAKQKTKLCLCRCLRKQANPQLHKLLSPTN